MYTKPTTGRSLGIAGRLFVLSLLWVPAESRASDSYKLALAAGVGYQTYSLSDVNHELVPGSILIPGAEVTMTGGWGYAAGLRLAASDGVVFGLDVRRLLASDTGEGSLVGQPYDYDLNLPANSITATATYFLVRSSWGRAGIGGGLGYYSADGKVKNTNSSGAEINSELRGSGLGAHALAISEISLNNRFCAELSVGYRYARTDHVKLTTVLGTNEYDSHIDWSGLATSVGISYYIAK